jgi:V/A-type H+-transporting ATPase subunit F
MARVAVIGDKDTILGFKAFGFNIFTVKDESEAREAWQEVCKSDHDLIFITEEYYQKMGDLIAEFSEKPVPAVLAIPNIAGATGLSIERIRKLAEKAIGADILSGREGYHGSR